MFSPLIGLVPGDFDVVRHGSQASVTLPLTVSNDGAVHAALDVRLWGGHWHGVEMHEFKFAIVVADDRTGDLLDIFDRYDAAPYIAPVRQLILPCVQGAASALIEAVAPRVIYRATYQTRPAGKSLAKHQMLTDTIARLGYRVLQSGRDSSNRLFWLMTKDGDA